MKRVLRGAGMTLIALVAFALFLSTCGFQKGSPDVQSSGSLARDVQRVLDECNSENGVEGFWIEGPPAVRVWFRDGSHTIVPCLGNDMTCGEGPTLTLEWCHG